LNMYHRSLYRSHLELTRAGEGEWSSKHRLCPLTQESQKKEKRQSWPE